MFFSWNQDHKKNKKDFLSRTSKANDFLKRTFLFLSDINIGKASATVEALLILPVVFLFFMSVVWILFLFYLHSMVGNIVNETGYQIVSYSYIAGKMADFTGSDSDKMLEAAESMVISEGFIRQKILKSEAGRYIDKLSCVLSRVDLDNEISLNVKYYVEPFIKIPGFRGFILTNRFYSKTYAGYSISCDKKEMVYITSNSVVYHTDRDCRSLKSNPEKVNLKHINQKRNHDGSRYYACKKCFKSGDSNVYIAPYGIKYHSDAECADLKITVYEVWNTEVKGRRKCYFCH